MQVLIEFPDLDLGTTSPDELASSITGLLEGGIELPDGILYANNVRVQIVEEGSEFPAPGPDGPAAGNSPSLRSVA